MSESIDPVRAAAVVVAGPTVSVTRAGHFRIRRLELEAFKCVETANVELGPGLNVLYGPNDLGKSSLGEALRAVLLLPPTSVDRKEFEPWGRDQAPLVRLRFDHDGASFRLAKTWGEGARGTAMLERSEDGNVWTKIDSGRAVDGALRKMLGWGVKEPGGKGAPKGLPKSFITTALLAASSRIEELFADDLGQDTDSAGRERLAQALESLAEDPMFKRILTEAQDQVDRTKDSRGNFRRAKDLPLGRIAERIRTLNDELEELDRQAQQSESVHEVLRVARQRQTALRDQLGDAHTERARRRAAYEAGAVWRAARDALATAREALAVIDREHARRARLSDEVAVARERVAAAVDEQQRMAAAAATAELTLRTASDELAALERSDATVTARAELGARELELGRRRQTITSARARVGDALALDRETATASASAAAALTALRGVEQQLAAKQAELLRSEAALRTAIASCGAAQWRDATARLAQLERRHAESQAAAARARLLRQGVAERRAELSRNQPPDAATLTALGDLDARRRRAEDQAAVGFAVTLRDAKEAPQITIDDHAPTSAAAGSTIVARRDMTIVIPGWGTLVVAAGSVELRDELATANARWQADGLPILAAHGAATFEALSAAAAAWSVLAEQCARDDASATALEREAAASAVDAATLAATRAEIDRAAAMVIEHAGAPADDTVIERVVGELGTRPADVLDRDRTRLDAAVQALRASQAELDVQVARATAASSERRRVADEAVARADASRRGLDPAYAADLVTAAAELDDELAAVERGATEVTRALATLAETGARTTAAVRDRVTAASAEVDRCRVAQREAELRTSTLREAAAAATARLEEAGATTGDSRETAAAEVERRERDLAALPEPATTESEQSLAAIGVEIERIDEQLRLADAEIQKAEGSLEQIGGQSARERLGDARAQLESSKRAEADMQRDVEGWEMLRDTLRAVETEQGRHVGDALASAVENRLRTLTRDRYGRLDLDRDLKAQGVRIAGSPRAITSLSAGLKEQLATLVRLAVAEHLDATVVLDDHLAQTDPSRVDYFRELLREVGGRVQIVVLTCRPLDYLELTELPTANAVFDATPFVRAIDLERVIARLPVTAG